MTEKSPSASPSFLRFLNSLYSSSTCAPKVKYGAMGIVVSGGSLGLNFKLVSLCAYSPDAVMIRNKEFSINTQKKFLELRIVIQPVNDMD